MHIIKESKYSWKTWKLPSLGFACRRLFIVRCKTIEREKRVSLELTSFQIVFAVWRRKKERKKTPQRRGDVCRHETFIRSGMAGRRIGVNFSAYLLNLNKYYSDSKRYKVTMGHARLLNTHFKPGVELQVPSGPINVPREGSGWHGQQLLDSLTTYNYLYPVDKED